MVVENFIDTGEGLEIVLPDGEVIIIDDFYDDDVTIESVLTIVDVETFHQSGKHAQTSHAGAKHVSIGGNAKNVQKKSSARVDAGRKSRNAKTKSAAGARDDYIGGTGRSQTSNFEDMNGVLRGKKITGQRREDALRQIGHMDSAFDEFGTMNKSEIIVHRGLSGPQFDRLSGRAGRTVTEKGYMSTSVDPRQAGRFGRTLEIRVPPGTVGLGGRSSEGEMIYPRGSRLRIIGPNRGGTGLIAEMV